MNPMDVIQRGYDSSGRPLVLTRQHWQFLDRLNAGAAQGLLVVIQGGFRRGSGAAASGDTHDLAKCSDIRRWNLSNQIAYDVKKAARDTKQVGGGSMWERYSWQGFDPHFHNLLVGDTPGSPGANAQEAAYIDGFNGLGSGFRGYPDDFWRPATITAYNYTEEEEDMTPEQDKRLKRIERLVEKHNKTETQRFRRIITKIGAKADQITLMINEAPDPVTKRELKKVQESILLALKEDPDVTEEDNPSDDYLADQNMG